MSTGSYLLSNSPMAGRGAPSCYNHAHSIELLPYTLGNHNITLQSSRLQFGDRSRSEFLDVQIACFAIDTAISFVSFLEAVIPVVHSRLVSDLETEQSFILRTVIPVEAIPSTKSIQAVPHPTASTSPKSDELEIELEAFLRNFDSTLLPDTHKNR
jgi:hypothetical protein